MFNIELSMPREDRRSPRPEIESRKRQRRVLEVRSIQAATAWLEGRIRFKDGRVVWEKGEQSITPGPAELSLAERGLRQVE